MKALGHVIRFEYLRQVRKRSFFWATFSLPLLVLVMVGMMFIMAWFSRPRQPVGYVAPAGLLQPADFQADDQPAWLRIQYTPLPDEATARRALEDGRLAAYVVVPPDYPQTTRLTLVYLRYPGHNVESDVQDALQQALLRRVPAEWRELSARLADGRLTWRYRLLGQEITRTPQQLAVRLAPIAAGYALLVLTFIASGYLLSVVADEKANRTAEVLVTSVTPTRLLAGKWIAITLLALTQMTVWLAFVVGGWLLLRSHFTLLRSLPIDWGTLFWPLVFVLPAYLILSGILATLGAMVSDASEAQQWTSLFTLPMMTPLFLAFLFLEHPNSPLALGLTFFPLTAPLTLLVRRAATDVPLWQTLLSQALAWATGLGAIWLSGYTFRLGMLRYGQRLRWRELFRRGGAA